MTKILLAALSMFIFSIGFSQSPTYEWTDYFSSDNDDYGRHVRIDGNGNIFTVGYFSDTIDLDPGPGVQTFISGGYVDTYILKLNPSGDLIWAKVLTGTLAVEVNGFQLDSDDNLYISGSYRGTADFDPGPGVDSHTTGGLRDIFVVKLDSSGGFIWSKTLGGTAWDQCYGLDIDTDRSVYVSGYFGDSVDFDPGAGSYNVQCGGVSDAYVLKLDSIGNFNWVVTYPNDSLSNANFVKVDLNDDILVGGFFYETMDFDPGPGVDNHASNGERDLFLTKLDSDGNSLWTITEGGISDDSNRGIAVNKDNDIFITGQFEETVDFDPATTGDIRTSNGLADIFIQKFKSNGTYEWTRTIGGDSSDIGVALTVDTFNYIYITGGFTDSVDFNTGPSTNIMVGDTLYRNLFVLKLDENGEYVWSTSAISPLGSLGLIIETNNYDEVYVTGAYQGIITFDPGGVNDTIFGDLDYRDAFITKYTQCAPTAAVISPVSCYSYTSPSENYTWTSSGIYMDTLVNSNSCGEDSILYINLTIDTIDNSISMIDQLTLQADGTGLQYQWLDCDNGYSIIPGETNQTFTATQNGNYAVEVNNGTCTDTSECMSINSVGIGELVSGTINVFPNPSDGVFTLQLNDLSATVRISISDSKGRIIQNSHEINSQQTTLDLIDQGKGLYFLHILSENEAQVVKLIIR